MGLDLGVEAVLPLLLGHRQHYQSQQITIAWGWVKQTIQSINIVSRNAAMLCHLCTKPEVSEMNRTTNIESYAAYSSKGCEPICK